jgi:predicted kinase
MHTPTLYLMVGYPGAGKTTVAKIIAGETGAIHLWADVERHRLFSLPTHSQSESSELYDQMNQQTETLLSENKNVVFDTNFNYRHDRDLLQKIAARQHAKTVVVWVTTPANTARQRAVHSEVVRNGYEFTMSSVQFDAIASKLEAPSEDENVIKIDGTEIDETAIRGLFST